MLRRLITIWLPIAAASTAVLLGAYAVGQQGMRQTANFVPEQMAEDSAYQLENGAVPAAVVPRNAVTVDVSHSVLPFIMVFDDHGTVLESSMKMGSDLPVPPSGIFAYVSQYGEERILTWQPASGIRLATTVIHWKSSVPATSSATSFATPPSTGGAISSGFVLAGQGLRIVEDTTQRLALMMFAGWIATMIGTLVIVMLTYWLEGKLKE